MIKMKTEEARSNVTHTWRLYWLHESDLDASYPATVETLRAIGYVPVAQATDAEHAEEQRERAEKAERERDENKRLAETIQRELDAERNQWRGAVERALGVEADPVEHTPSWAHERVLAKREIGNGLRDESGLIPRKIQLKDPTPSKTPAAGVKLLDQQAAEHDGGAEKVTPDYDRIRCDMVTASRQLVASPTNETLGVFLDAMKATVNALPSISEHEDVKRERDAAEARAEEQRERAEKAEGELLAASATISLLRHENAALKERLDNYRMWKDHYGDILGMHLNIAEVERERDAAESRAEEQRERAKAAEAAVSQQHTELNALESWLMHMALCTFEEEYKAYNSALCKLTELRTVVVPTEADALRAECSALETKLAEQDLVNQRTREENAELRQEIEDVWRNDYPITNTEALRRARADVEFCEEIETQCAQQPGGDAPVAKGVDLGSGDKTVRIVQRLSQKPYCAACGGDDIVTGPAPQPAANPAEHRELVREAQMVLLPDWHPLKLALRKLEAPANPPGPGVVTHDRRVEGALKQSSRDADALRKELATERDITTEYGRLAKSLRSENDELRERVVGWVPSPVEPIGSEGAALQDRIHTETGSARAAVSHRAEAPTVTPDAAQGKTDAAMIAGWACWTGPSGSRYACPRSKSVIGVLCPTSDLSACPSSVRDWLQQAR